VATNKVDTGEEVYKYSEGFPDIHTIHVYEAKAITIHAPIGMLVEIRSPMTCASKFTYESCVFCNLYQMNKQHITHNAAFRTKHDNVEVKRISSSASQGYVA
jgi:hypothetical protein